MGACVATAFTSRAAKSVKGRDNMRTHARSAKLWCGRHAPRGEFAPSTRHHRGASAHGAAGTAKKRNEHRTHRTVKTVGVTIATALLGSCRKKRENQATRKGRGKRPQCRKSVRQGRREAFEARLLPPECSLKASYCARMPQKPVARAPRGI